MAVTSLSLWAVRPGKAAEFAANIAQAKAIHTRLGGSVRVRQILFGGPSSQQFAYAIEVPDMTAFANFSDKLASDAEWQKFWTGIGAQPDPSATLVSQSLAQDVPGL
jgi:hypothetical protein